MTRRTTPKCTMRECEAVVRKLANGLDHLWNLEVLRADAECDRLIARLPACATMEELCADLDLLHLRVNAMAAEKRGEVLPAHSLNSGSGPASPRGSRRFLQL
jgi:hypothetical protein